MIAKRWVFKVLPIILLQWGRLWSHRLLRVQTARFLINVKRGFASVLWLVLWVCDRKSRLSDSFDWAVFFLCQRWVKSLQGLWKIASVRSNSPLICWHSFLIYPFCFCCTHFFFISPSIPLCVARCRLLLVSPSVWPQLSCSLSSGSYTAFTCCL